MHKRIFAVSAALVSLFLSIALSGCIQVGRQAEPASVAQLSGRYSNFTMGGVDIKSPVPMGYVDAPQAVRQAAGQTLTPAENIFAAYMPAPGKASGSGAALLRNQRIILLSARPEFTREIVDKSFFAAMGRDLKRVNGAFSPERLGQFKVLTGNYYARDDAFSHSLGVCDSRPGSISIARIVRQASSRGQGAVSAYAGEHLPEGEKLPDFVLQGWDKSYFARAYHYVLVQNVLLVQGRCLNVYFFAPLAAEEDVYFAIRENAAYLDALSSGMAGLGAGRLIVQGGSPLGAGRAVTGAENN